jgi:glycosyltransferase involved in cell wall biosynthesis
VLWVTDEPPDRNQGGGNIRQAGLLDGICDRVDVTLLLVGHLRDEVTRAKLGEVLEIPTPRRRTPRSLTQRRIRDIWHAVVRRRPAEILVSAPVRRAMKPALGRLADDFDVVVVHHFHLAPLVPPKRRAKWLLHPHNVLSIRAGDELLTEPGRRQRWLLGRQVIKSARYEKQAAAAYDGLMFVSDEDATAMAGKHGERARGPVIVVPNGVDPSAFTASPIPREPRVVLPASLNYRPNVLGALWFCDEVWPRVQSEVPGARFDLVGRDPVDEVLELARLPGVEVHPNVPRIAPWLERARVVVVPLWIGSGTRLKALDAMAACRPVVGTSIGLQGLGVVDGVHACIADDPSSMADSIVQLLTSDATAESLAVAGRQLVEDRFRWDDLADRFADGVEAVAALKWAPRST